MYLLFRLKLRRNLWASRALITVDQRVTTGVARKLCTHVKDSRYVFVAVLTAHLRTLSRVVKLARRKVGSLMQNSRCICDAAALRRPRPCVLSARGQVAAAITHEEKRGMIPSRVSLLSGTGVQNGTRRLPLSPLSRASWICLLSPSLFLALLLSHKDRRKKHGFPLTF